VCSTWTNADDSKSRRHLRGAFHRGFATCRGRRQQTACAFHQRLQTVGSRGWCQTQISILLTAHLCLINDWARRCHGYPAERPSGVHSVIPPHHPLPPPLNRLLGRTWFITPAPWCQIKCGLLESGAVKHKHRMDTNIRVTPRCVKAPGCLSVATLACSSSAWGMKWRPCKQVWGALSTLMALQRMTLTAWQWAH